jgi:N-acetyl-anhydromuramyl-L-alanine amidase AmpD
MTSKFIGCAPTNFRRGRPAPYRPEAIVIHIMAGSLAGTDSWFGSPVSSVSAHYGVGKNGEIHQYVQEEDTAFHAGTVDRPSWASIKRTPAGQIVNPNFYTLGIEHEGFPDDDWPAAQQAASVAVIAEMAARWRIPLDRQHVILHHEIRQSKPCPGAKAPIDQLILQALAAAPAPQAGPAEVTAISNLNVRAGLPHTTAPVRRVVTVGTVLPVAGFTAVGQTIGSNSFWYQDAAGDFFWAGNTDRPNPTT